jgi:hypothetical protein
MAVSLGFFSRFRRNNNINNRATDGDTAIGARQAGRVSWGNSITGRGELRFHIFSFQIITAAILCFCYWTNYNNAKTLQDFANNGYTVFQIDPDGRAVAKKAGDFHTPPTSVEIAWISRQIIRDIFAAGSKDVEDSYKDAAHLMTPPMKETFLSNAKPDEIRALNIYRRLENVTVRRMTEKDLPPGDNIQLTDYDVILTGRVDTYRLQTNDLLDSGEVAFELHLSPLPERTDEYPNGVLVSSVEKVMMKPAPAPNTKAPDSSAKPADTAKSTNTPTTPTEKKSKSKGKGGK